MNYESKIMGNHLIYCNVKCINKRKNVMEIEKKMVNGIRTNFADDLIHHSLQSLLNPTQLNSIPTYIERINK